MPYRVVIFPSKKQAAASTSANVWVAISGSLAETKQVATPRGTFEFVFHVSVFVVRSFDSFFSHLDDQHMDWYILVMLFYVDRTIQNSVAKTTVRILSINQSLKKTYYCVF